MVYTATHPGQLPSFANPSSQTHTALTQREASYARVSVVQLQSPEWQWPLLGISTATEIMKEQKSDLPEREH